MRSSFLSFRLKSGLPLISYDGGRLERGGGLSQTRVVGGRLETGCNDYQERVAPESAVGAALGPVAGPQGRRINAPSPPPWA